MLASDKVPVFVSARLAECAAERSNARRAIRSLNHNPILFEDFGARPHPPRAMYMRGLSESHIFVGIYRDGYGWTAPGMTISGLEDELRIATDLGLPRLVYEHRPGSERDPKLAQLLAEIKLAGITVGSYEDPGELYERIRDDITALISERFLASRISESVTALTPQQRLAELVRVSGPLVIRRDVEASLKRMIATEPVVAVTGKAGSGKTVLLTQLSAANGWSLVDGEGVSPEQIAVRCVKAIAEHSENVGISAVDDPGALQQAWSAASAITLVIDGVASTEALEALISDVENARRDRHLVLGSRALLEGIPVFPIPQWREEEVAELLQGLGQQERGDDLGGLVQASEGNPLYLQFALRQPEGVARGTLEQYEINTVRQLAPRARELVTYLAMSRGPLDLALLGELLADPPMSPEGVSDIVRLAAGLVSDTEQGLTLFHAHLAQTIIADIRKSRVRALFYSDRLARVLRRRGDMDSAYAVLAGVDNPRAAEVLPEAALLATVRGDISTAIPLLTKRLDIAQSRLDRSTSIRTLLNLAILEAQRGSGADSRRWLAQADAELTQHPDRDLALGYRETLAQVELTFGGTEKALETLAELRRLYESTGDVHGIARIDFRLGSHYLHTHRFSEALAASERAMEGFRQAGDDYGLVMTKGNRAVALSALPGRTTEADSLLSEMESQDIWSKKRMRALVCNVLARRHRENGDTIRARAFAKEAIQLGRELGDRQIALLNTINLGNSYRDEGMSDVPGAFEQALVTYAAAREESSQHGFRMIETHALRLRAGVYSRQERFSLALTEAEAALVVARNTVDGTAIGEVQRERADALRGMRRYGEAAGAYLAAAEAVQKVEGYSAYCFDLVRRALRVDSLGTPPTAYLLDGLTRVFASTEHSGRDDEGMRRRVDDVLRSYIGVAARVPVTEVYGTSLDLLNTLLHDCPQKLAEVITTRFAQELLKDVRAHRTQPYLLALVGVLASRGAPAMSMWALVSLVESLPMVSGLSFRPQQDGAAHWCLRLDLGQAVTCTVTQMDGSANGFFVALLVAAVCWAFEGELHERLLLGVPLARQEIAVMVSSVGVLSREIQKEVEFRGPCSVTRATNPKSDQEMPMLVLYKEQELEALRAEGRGTEFVRLLSGEVLIELVYHLLKGEVDLESLGPKVVSLVRDIS